MAQGKPGKKATPPPTPPPAAEARSAEEDSSRGSGRASASEPVVADPGPEFDPTAPPPLEQPPLEEPGAETAAVLWEEQAISDLLGIKGRVLHAALGAAEEDWIYTELDLAAIAPPLTRICNRYDPVRQYAGYGDPITVAVGMAGYFTRSVMERRVALAQEAPAPTEHPIPPAESFAHEEPVDRTPPPPPGPPPPRQATALPPQGTGSRTATPPPPPPPGAINAEEVAWEQPNG